MKHQAKCPIIALYIHQDFHCFFHHTGGLQCLGGHTAVCSYQARYAKQGATEVAHHAYGSVRHAGPIYSREDGPARRAGWLTVIGSPPVVSARPDAVRKAVVSGLWMLCAQPLQKSPGFSGAPDRLHEREKA